MELGTLDAFVWLGPTLVTSEGINLLGLDGVSSDQWTSQLSPEAWGQAAPRILCSILILALSAFVQATVGFAAGLLGLPLLLWAGNDLMSAQVMIVTAMLPQNILAVWKLRTNLSLREVVAPAAIRIAFLPIGIAGLSIVLTWSTSAINQLVGCIILLAVGLQSLVGIEWKNAKHPFWLITTFGSSGILQGLSGTSGPPMVLWVHGQRYTADHARAFLFAMYISNYIPQMSLLFWKFGSSVGGAAGVATLSIPLVMVAAALGLRLGSWVGDHRLRTLTYACLIVLATGSMLEPWITNSVVPWVGSLFSDSP